MVHSSYANLENKSKVLFISVFVVSIFLASVSIPDVHALNYIINGQASCNSIGGTWNNGSYTFPPLVITHEPSCVINGFTLNSKDMLTIDVNLNNTGLLTNNNGTVVMNVPLFVNNTGIITNNNGTIRQISHLLDNYGTIDDTAGGITSIQGTLSNSGIITGGEIANADGSITNYGTIDMENNDTLLNEGNIHNYGKLVNHGKFYNSYIINYANLTNFGTIFNGGTMNNYNGTFSNSGAVNNTSNLYNNGTINNSGKINNLDSIDNLSIINNSGTINNFLFISNRGSINNQCGAIYSGILPSGNPINDICLHSTTISITSSSNLFIFGQKINFTAIVSPNTATGNVTFAVDGTQRSIITLQNGTDVYSTSLLSIGTHNATASYSGNSSFMPSISLPISITILTPVQATQSLIDIVNSMNLSHSITDRLDNKLEMIANDLNSGDNKSAIIHLNNFINAVESQTGKKITQEQANLLVSEAQNIINLI